VLIAKSVRDFCAKKAKRGRNAAANCSDTAGRRSPRKRDAIKPSNTDWENLRPDGTRHRS
jgi:hypothetical protein